MSCFKTFSLSVVEVEDECFDPELISWSEQQFPSGAGAFVSANMAGTSGSFSVASQNVRNATAQNASTVILTGTFNKLTPGSCVARFTFDYSWNVQAVANANLTIQLFLLGVAPPDVIFQPAGVGSEEISFDGFVVPGANEIQIWFQIRGSTCPGVINNTPCTPSIASGTVTLTPLPVP